MEKQRISREEGRKSHAVVLTTAALIEKMQLSPRGRGKLRVWRSGWQAK